MNYSKLTIEQQNAIYPVFADLILDKNLFGFSNQLFGLTLNVEMINKGSSIEKMFIRNLSNCVRTMYASNFEKDLQKSVNQFTSQIPIFVDLVCSKEIEKASYTFEKITDGSVWFNILNQKRKIYESLVNYHELQEQNKSQSKQQIAA